jgi:hypothetical protein
MSLVESHRELCPGVLVTRRPPVHLRPQDVDLFRHELERHIPPSHLLRIDNVRITPDGLLVKRATILRESFPFAGLRDHWKARSIVKVLSRAYLSRHIRDVDDETLWVTDTWSTGYFHWLTDVSSKLQVVREIARQHLLLLPHGCEPSDFVRGSLEAFGIRRVQFIREEEIVRCRRLLLPTPIAPSGHFRVDVIRAVREDLTRHFAPDTPAVPAGRVYISRRAAQKRRITNEPEVIAVLRGWGFDVVQAETLSLADQIRIASQARYLISNHGAGLTNMLFMRPGGHVFELRHRGDRINNCYFALASALELHYWYQTCASPSGGEDPHTADVVVDTDALETNLSLMFRE